MTRDPDPEWLSVQAVATYFSVSYCTAIKWIRAGLFDEVLHTKGIIRISRASVDRFAKAQRVTPAVPPSLCESASNGAKRR